MVSANSACGLLGSEITFENASQSQKPAAHHDITSRVDGESEFVIDTNHLPLLITTWFGSPSHGLVEAYGEWFVRFVEGNRTSKTRFVILDDALRAGRPGSAGSRLLTRITCSTTAEAFIAGVAQHAPEWHPLVVVAMRTGLRIGGRLRVQQSYNRENKFMSTKNDKLRELPLTWDAIAALRSQRERVEPDCELVLRYRRRRILN